MLMHGYHLLAEKRISRNLDVFTDYNSALAVGAGAKIIASGSTRSANA